MYFLLNQQVLDLGDRDAQRARAERFLGGQDVDAVRLQDAVSRAWAALSDPETDPSGPCSLLSMKLDANTCILSRRADGETDLKLARLPDATLSSRAPKHGETDSRPGPSPITRPFGIVAA